MQYVRISIARYALLSLVLLLLPFASLSFLSFFTRVYEIDEQRAVGGVGRGLRWVWMDYGRVLI